MVFLSQFPVIHNIFIIKHFLKENMAHGDIDQLFICCGQTHCCIRMRTSAIFKKCPHIFVSFKPKLTQRKCNLK